MNILGGLIHNAALLLTLALAYSLLIARLPRERLSTQLLNGLLFGLAALIGMLDPVILRPGVFFDGRTVLLSMAGLFGGWAAAGVAATIAMLGRVWLGGPGEVMGIATILTAASLGILAHLARSGGRMQITVASLFVFSVLVHLASLIWIVSLPEAALRIEVLESVALPFLIVLPGIGVLLGLLLHMHERRAADERNLRETGIRLTEARRLAGLGDWEWDLRTKTPYWSEEIFRIYGQDPDSPPLGYPELRRYFTPSSWSRLSPLIEACLHQGTPYQCDAEVIRVDGAQRWVMLRGEAIRDARGEITRLRGTMQDITEHQNILDALAREHGFLSTLIYTIPDLIWLKDPDGVYLACNTRFENFFGASEFEIKGRTDADFLPPEQASFFRANDLKALAAGGPCINEERITFANDGHSEHLETIKTPMYDAEGHLIGVLGIARDITPKLEAQEALRRERDRMGMLLETVEAIILVLDTEGCITLINRQGCQLLGESAEALIGQNWFVRTALDVQEARTSESEFRDWLNNPLDGARSSQARIRAHDGRERIIAWHCSVLRDESGQVSGTLSAGEDVTERLRMESELREREFFFRESQHAARIGSYKADFNADWWESSDILDDIFGIDEHYPRTVQGWLDLIHPDDQARMQRYLHEEVLARGAAFNMEYRIIRPADGIQRWVLGLGQISRDAHGQVISLMGTIQDISARKDVEVQVQLAASVFAHSLDAITLTDAENRIVDVNPSFTRITGYTREEVIGQNPSILASGRHDAAFYRDMWADLQTQGFWRGEIWNRRKNGEIYPEVLSISVVRDVAGEVQNHIGMFTDISHLKAHEEELDRLAHYDHLTGVPNRRLLIDRLTQAIDQTLRSNRLLAVCYLDLDDFKPINDCHGHAVGDQLLIKITETLRSVLRAQDTIARLGGDEFVLLLNAIARPEDCYGLLERILTAARQPITVQGTTHRLSASIGVTLCPPDREDPDTLLRHADQAMYRAKEQGRNGYHLYDSDQDQALQKRLANIQRLEQALEHGEFVLYYQPQVDLISREIIGCEALIRWRHPEQGVLPPGAFLPDIEGSELEIRVSEWVIDSALRQIGQWKEQGLQLRVSVNLAARHLLSRDFVADLRKRLQAHPRISPSELELEILETAALNDFERARQVLAECRALGVHFALDDFGTGYSSLAYFRALPVDILKIDQSFVRDMVQDAGDMDIVESVVRLSNAFNREVIAEGVETLEHAALLTWLGCRLAQGYGIAYPMPAAEIPAWARSWLEQPVWRAIEVSSGRDDIALMMAALNYRYWMHRLLEAIEHGDCTPLDALSEADAQLEHWCQDQGMQRYGTLTAFSALEDARDCVRTHAAQLIAQVRSGRSTEARNAVVELRSAHEDLLDGFNQVVRQVRRKQTLGAESNAPTSDPAASAPLRSSSPDSRAGPTPR